MNTRIGIMGGSFDPVHIGHLVAASEAYAQFNLDRVIFMVAGKHPDKHQNASDAVHRLAMTRLAIAGDDRFEVSDLEVRREGITYTVDTIRQLRKQYPKDTEFFFITGADAVLDIVRWKDSRELAKLVTFIATTRPGSSLKTARDKRFEDAENFDIRFIRVAALAISSTDIRHHVSCGFPIKYLVRDSVGGYIIDNGLYLEAQSRKAGKK